MSLVRASLGLWAIMWISRRFGIDHWGGRGGRGGTLRSRVGFRILKLISGPRSDSDARFCLSFFFFFFRNDPHVERVVTGPKISLYLIPSFRVRGAFSSSLIARVGVGI